MSVWKQRTSPALQLAAEGVQKLAQLCTRRACNRSEELKRILLQHNTENRGLLLRPIWQRKSVQKSAHQNTQRTCHHSEELDSLFSTTTTSSTYTTPNHPFTTNEQTRLPTPSTWSSPPTKNHSKEASLHHPKKHPQPILQQPH